MSRWWIAALVVLVACAACANHVKQNKATGPDGVAKGARPIELEEEPAADPKQAPTYRGQAAGIVTYPGGDRVDWKLIELPADKRGRLDLKLSWTTPRPGLRLAFEVYDARAKRVVAEAPSKGRSHGHTIEDAAGKYFVRIYAQRRGDAGAYKLVAAFAPATEAEAPPPIDVPMPPPLPAIEIPTCPKFDVDNPDCQKVCDKAAPSGWKGCPPCHKFSRQNPDCEDVCPAGAPRNWPACVAQRPPCETFDRADPQCADRCPKGAPADWPACVKTTPVVAENKGTSVIGDEVEILLKVDRSSPVTKDWIPELLDGKTDRPRAGGKGRIVSAGGGTVKVRFRLTKDITDANPRVRLSPPAAP